RRSSHDSQELSLRAKRSNLVPYLAEAAQRKISMPVSVLYPETRQAIDDLERAAFGPDVRIVKRDAGALSELSDADCAEADGLMIMGFGVTGADLARFPRLRAIVRMGVGYDKLDRPAAAARNVLICNVPDYGTTEVADH